MLHQCGICRVFTASLQIMQKHQDCDLSNSRDEQRCLKMGLTNHSPDILAVCYLISHIVLKFSLSCNIYTSILKLCIFFGSDTKDLGYTYSLGLRSKNCGCADYLVLRPKNCSSMDSLVLRCLSSETKDIWLGRFLGSETKHL